MLHTYLFVMERGLIARYKVLPNGKYTLVRYSNDEKGRAFSENFWETWKTDASFIDGDSLDAALLSDDPDFQFTIPQDMVCDSTKFFTEKWQRSFPEKVDMIKGTGNQFSLTIFSPNSQSNPKSQNSSKYTLGDYLAEEKEKWNQRRS